MTNENLPVKDVQVSLEFTPNPNSLKYQTNQTLLEKGTLKISSIEEASTFSTLASKLMTIPGVAHVAISRSAITVTKNELGDWDIIHKDSVKTIGAHLRSNEAVITPAAIEKLNTTSSSTNTAEIEAKIKEVLENEIRPAVAMDGGDIEFVKYEEGIVYVHLFGACSGCAGAGMTLKFGVEARLQEIIPEIQEVLAV